MTPTSVLVPVAIVRHNGLTLSSVLQNESCTDNTESKVCDKQTLAHVINRIGDKMSYRYLPEACNALTAPRFTIHSELGHARLVKQLLCMICELQGKFTISFFR